jgi:hypothetical protein
MRQEIKNEKQIKTIIPEQKQHHSLDDYKGQQEQAGNPLMTFLECTGMAG